MSDENSNANEGLTEDQEGYLMILRAALDILGTSVNYMLEEQKDAMSEVPKLELGLGLLNQLTFLLHQEQLIDYDLVHEPVAFEIIDAETDENGDPVDGEDGIPKLIYGWMPDDEDGDDSEAEEFSADDLSPSRNLH